MTIKVIKEPDVYLTEAELRRLRYEYDRAFSYYSGPVPSFEEFVRTRQQNDTASQRSSS